MCRVIRIIRLVPIHCQGVGRHVVPAGTVNIVVRAVEVGRFRKDPVLMRHLPKPCLPLLGVTGVFLVEFTADLGPGHFPAPDLARVLVPYHPQMLRALEPLNVHPMTLLRNRYSNLLTLYRPNLHSTFLYLNPQSNQPSHCRPVLHL
jgi:hypothetical protein